MILDAAVVAFATRGFHACRVSDIADEANVAYGLVYHYFRSKDEVLDTLFLERWNVLLEVIAEIDAQPLPAREKLHAIASFIIDSYRHDPDLMKVIIVEVTRAANSFGRTHLAKIREAYALIADIVGKAQADGTFRTAVTPALRGAGVLRRDRAGPDRLDLRHAAPGRGRVRRGEGVHRRDDLRRTRRRRRPRIALPPEPSERMHAMPTNEMAKRLIWSGLLAGLGAIASIATTRAAAMIWRRIYGEDPPE